MKKKNISEVNVGAIKSESTRNYYSLRRENVVVMLCSSGYFQKFMVAQDTLADEYFFIKLLKNSQSGNAFENVKQKNLEMTRFEDTSLLVKLLVAGTGASIADIVTFPLDTAKVRLQIQGEKEIVSSIKVVPRYRGVFSTITTIAREEGPKSLYNGLSAGLQRQMCFASIRIGLYDNFKDFYQNLAGGRTRSDAFDVLTRVCAGLTTGALAVVVAQPTDIVKIRFQAHQGKQERYKSTREAYKTIFKVEGVRGLWKGTYPNIARNCIVNVSEIVCYDIVKDAILRRALLRDNIVCHFVSAVVAGFCTTVVASPVDVIKTRYMNSFPGQYKGAVHCALETIQKEGITAYYKGFIPSFYRLMTWNIVMWTTYEKLKFFVTKILSDQ